MSTDATTTTDESPPPHGDYRRYRGSKSVPKCADGPDGRPCELCRAANAKRARDGGYDAAWREARRNERQPVEIDGVWRLVHPDPPRGPGSTPAAIPLRCGGADCRRKR